MKKLLIMVCLGCFVALAGPADYALGQTMSVQVKKGQLRSAPSFMGKVTNNLKYGERVFVLEEKGAWRLVQLNDEKTKGWMHDSALTIKEISFEAGSRIAKKSLAANEVTLGGKALGTGGSNVLIAGKGFNQRSEDEFRQGNPGIDFTWIDKMATWQATRKEMKKFLKKGKLQPEGSDI